MILKQLDLRIMLYKNGIFIILLSIILFSFFSIILPAHAQESSSSGKAELSETTPSGIMSKIEDLKREIASKAADLKQEIDKRTQNKALVGKIGEISEGSISLSQKNGDHTIRLNEYTLYQNNTGLKTRRAFSQSDLKVGDFIVTLGDIDEKGSMTAKKVIKIEPLIEPKKEFTMGQVASISGQLIQLQKKDGSQVEFRVDSKTVVREGKNESTITEISSKKRLIIMTIDQSKTASFVYMYPVSGIIKSNNDQSASSPSGSPNIKRN